MNECLSTMAAATVFTGIVGAAVVIGLLWGLASRRSSLPCPVWLRWLVELDNPFAQTNHAAFIVEHLSLEPGMRVLDAGCGPGRLTIPLAKRIAPGKVLALDLQAGMLSRAKQKVEAAGLTNIEFLHAGLSEVTLPRGAFDRAVMVTVLGEIPDRFGALREVFAALRPGGILSISEIIFDPHFQTRRVVANLAKRVGFQEEALLGGRFAYLMLLRKPK